MIRCAAVVCFIALCLLTGGCSEPSQGSDAAPLDAGVDTAPDVERSADAGPALVEADRALDLVDPFIGTGGRGFGYAALTPAAQVPNGLVKLGPDTTNNGNHPPLSHFSGYNYADPEVRGFSHLHLIGTGAAGLGNLRVLPVAQVDPDEPWRQFTAMDKDSEQGAPGYYSVELPDAQVRAELTATLRGGFHRYRADSGALTLLFDPASSITESSQTDVDMTVEGNTIEGRVVYGGDFATRNGPFTLHFSATLDPAPSAVSTWTEQGVADGATSARGSRGGAVLGFEDAAGVELRVGLSLVDLAQARLHRREELDGRSFEQVRAAAEDAWKDKLGRIRVRGGAPSEQTIFYTAMYNLWRMPTRLDGADGRYRGVDGQVRTLEEGRYFSDMSLWDSFRTLHPLMILIDSELQRDCLRSLLAMHEATGYIPRWPAMQSFTGSMIGTAGDQLFAGSALKGIDGVDYDLAFEALLDTATTSPPADAPFSGRTGVERYVELGWVPDDEFEESVSRTLEFAWGDWALANLAAYLGRPEAAELRARSFNWQNLYDPDAGLFVPRNADGTFGVPEPGDFGREGPYTEGNAWHWRFYPIWHPDELVEAYGGSQPFGAILSTFFEDSGIGSGNLRTVLPDQRYWHGNEHDLGAAYLFHFAGRPEQVGRWVRAIQTTAYNAAPDGIPGNDDGGTLSAWYVFSALGFSPVAGSDAYMLGAPLFPFAEVDLADGETLVVEAEGADADTWQVSEVSVDGVRVDGAQLRHSQLMGTTLRFEIGRAD